MGGSLSKKWLLSTDIGDILTFNGNLGARNFQLNYSGKKIRKHSNLPILD
jgi:hypothetical protein